VHVGHEDIEAAVVVEVEHLDAHGAPRRTWEHLAALPDEPLAAGVLVILVVALHVQDVEVEPAVVVDVDRAGVSGPGELAQARSLGNVREPVPALVAVQDAALGTRRLEVAREGVVDGDVVAIAVARDLVRRIPPDVDQEQVEPAVAVVVEEHRARRVAGIAHAGGR
jgi:hypothetical protein